MLEFTTISIQIILPLILISWIALAPMQSRVGFALQAIMTLSALSALAMVSIWIVPPWWTPYVYITIYLFCLCYRMPRLWQSEQLWPRRLAEYLGLILLVPAGLAGVILTSGAIAGRTIPAGLEVIDLPMPLRQGTYLVANGGSTEFVNGHFLTLE